jgi:hypothetical protein
MVRGFKLGRERLIFKNDKIRSTTFFGEEVKPSSLRRKILRLLKIPTKYGRDTSQAKLTAISPQASPRFSTGCLYWYFSESSGG